MAILRLCVNIHTAKYSVKFLSSGPTEKNVHSYKSIELLYGQTNLFFRISNVISVYAVIKVAVIKVAAVGGRVLAARHVCYFVIRYARHIFNS